MIKNNCMWILLPKVHVEIINENASNPRKNDNLLYPIHAEILEINYKL